MENEGRNSLGMMSDEGRSQSCGCRKDNKVSEIIWLPIVAYLQGVQSENRNHEEMRSSRAGER